MWVITVLTTLASQNYSVFHQQNYMLEWNSFILLDCLASSLITNSVKRNIFQNGHVDQDKPLSWYIAAACRKCCSSSEYQNWIYFFTIPHRLWWLFYNNGRKDNKQTPRQLGKSFQKLPWTATRGIPVQHRKIMENPDWPFRGTSQGKQQLGEISVFSTWFGLRKFGRLGLGSKINSRTKDSGCSCNIRI